MQQVKGNTIDLRHPTKDVPATAVVLDFWLRNGRNAGLKLQFPGGHTCCLTYAEIADLQTNEETTHDNPQ